MGGACRVDQRVDRIVGLITVVIHLWQSSLGSYCLPSPPPAPSGERQQTTTGFLVQRLSPFG